MHDVLKRHPKLGLPLPVGITGSSLSNNGFNDDSASSSAGDGKEVHFFDWNLRKGLDWYASKFLPPPSPNGAHHPLGKTYGECTPDYLLLPLPIIEEIVDNYPGLKVIFIARELEPRTVSAVKMQTLQDSLGLTPGEFIPSSSSKMNPKRHPINDLTPALLENALLSPTHLAFSDYTRGLTNWVAVLGRANILVLDFKRIEHAPEGLVREVCDFLAVEVEVSEGDFFTAKADCRPAAGKAKEPGWTSPAAAGGDQQTEAGGGSEKRPFWVQFGNPGLLTSKVYKSAGGTPTVKVSKKVKAELQRMTREFNGFLAQTMGLGWKLGGSVSPK